MRLIAFVVLFMALPGSLLAAASLEVLKKRAEQYQELGLMDLAREQWLFIQKATPSDANVKKNLAKLSEEQSQLHLSNALEARKYGAHKLALYELKRALAASPSDKRIKALYQETEKEGSRKMALYQRISADYSVGLAHFEARRYERALETFVKVLNMAPGHMGARRYVERIGEKLGLAPAGAAPSGVAPKNLP